MTDLPVHARLLAETAWLRSLARRLVGGELATDLEQDVAVAALQRPEQAATGRSWFAAVAHNLATSLRRRRAAEQRRLGALPLPDGVPSPAELVATAELQQRAVAAVLALPPAYRDTILMRFLQGLSLQATATAMGVPEETVRTRQKRALARLREQLAPRRERRRGAALLASLAAWSAVVNAKVVVAGVAVLMVAVLATVPFRPVAPTSSGAMAPGVAAARGGVADATQVAGGPVAGGPLAGEDGARRIVVAAPTPEASAARLTVRLTWTDSRAPAAGVVVLCRPTTEAGRVGFTDAAGEVRFAPLPAGEYSVITQDWNSETTTLAAGEERTIARALPRGSSVTGLVLGPDDRPVAGAEILVSSAGTVPQWLLPVARSDLHGRFHLVGLRSGSLVGARHELLATSPFCLLRSPPADASATPMTLRLPGSGAAIRGQVVDERGAAVIGAFVELGEYLGNFHADAKGDLSQDPPATLETTDANGRFAAAALRPGALRVSVYRRGLAPHREVVHLEAAAVQELTVTLHPGTALIGRVLDAGGQVVAGTTVERRTACEFPERRQCDADVEGRFRFDDLPLGENEFEVAAPDFPRQRRSFVFAGSETQQWDVVLQRGVAIRCRLVDHASAPLVGWWLRLRGSDRGYVTDGDGRCLIPEADAAGNTLVVRARPGFVPEVLRVEHVVPGEQEQTFVVGPEHRASAWLRGHTVDAGGAALADAEIELVQDGWPLLLSEQNVRSGADGAFAVGPLPPGRYELQPAHRDCVFAAVAVMLQPNEQRDLGTLRGAEPSGLVVKLTGDATAIARTTVVLVAGDRTLGSAGEGAERTFARVFPMRYRIALRGRDQDLDCGEIDLAPGSEVVREIAVS